MNSLWIAEGAGIFNVLPTLCLMAHTCCQVAKASDILLLLLNKTAQSSTWSKVVVTTGEEISLMLCTKAILALSGISFPLTHHSTLQLGSKWPLTQAGTRQSGIFTAKRDFSSCLAHSSFHLLP